jgi:NADH-quinone oxidoreductase subunit M
MMLSTHLLSWLIFLPIVGGVAVLGMGHRTTLAKWLSLAVSGLALLLSIPLWTWF